MKTFGERMRESAERHGSRVVLALDFWGPYETRLERATKALRSVRVGVAGVKVNQHLLLPYGLEGLKGVVAACKEAGLPLIADLKLNDIEATNLNAADSLLAYGFDALIANPFVGRADGLGKVVETMHARGGGVLLLVYMSHGGADEEYGLLTEGGEPMHRVFARRARDWGADGVVVSAKSAAVIEETRSVVGERCLIFSPGVGAQGGNPQTAGGADFLIVGRSITESEDPAAALRRLASG